MPLNQSGYFQVSGASPGKYMLVVECPVASAVRELQVRAKGETRIVALPLEDLILNVSITPKLDPGGQPWLLSVDATTPRLRAIADKATASTDGHWTRRGLTAGNYRVNVSSSDGRPWLQKFFNLSAESGPLSFRLPFIRVQGEVRLNSQPVRAHLMFHNDAGGEPMTLTSDDGGFFQGLLPVTPDARETKWTVEVHGVQPPISRRVSGVKVQSVGEATAWFDLDLPVFAVHGTVVSDKGQLQSGVQVTFEDITNGIRTSTATDDSGGFELLDLPPGKYAVVAESLEAASERRPFQVVQGIESELKLVLKPFESVPFQVVSRAGPVANAAVQVWITPGIPRFSTRTDVDGRFEVTLPPGTIEIGLTVGAPGYAVKLMRLPIANETHKLSDANTITLDESGGELMLNLQAADSSATPYLVHKGAIEALGTLVDLGGAQAGAGNRGTIVVRAIEPGDYALCLLVDSSQLSMLWFGGLPADRCRRGSVKQGETLTLSTE